jgi:puromycin-sensitive aminopeptidase
MPSARAPSRFRLPADVRPVLYDLHLEPDLARGTFRGEVRIGVHLAVATNRIVLHAADQRVTHAQVKVGREVLPATVTAQTHDETITVAVRRPLLAGDATLVLRYTARLSRHLRGFYAVSSGPHRYAFTQCETADARRVLPCFDEPAFKARFRVCVTARRGDAVVSNAPVERERRQGAKRVVQFATTPPLSTYLLAVAVGPLEATAPRLLGKTPIRVWYVPGKAHLAGFGLEAAAESLRRLERYFGIPYPYGKLDLVAVPDFEAGAMENAGAVFFRETLLLLDSKTVTIAERKRVAEVIAHELAHMWYGNLVTMAWWDDLWLNEAFATWMAYRVVHDWQRPWRMWETFEHDRAGALGLDALTNTHPIYAPVRSVAEATENFDVITYEKGAAVVRMIEHYLGADTFRKGVRIYMRRHREGNAKAADLWRALEEASGREVTRVAHAWVAQAGFPLVSLERTAQGMRVGQARFFADARVPARARRTRWPVPLVLKLPERRTERVLADRAVQTVKLPRRARWCFGNAAAGGFYRVSHDPADLAAMLERPGQTLTPVERMALVGDQWALVRAGRATVDSFLDVVDALGNEGDHDVIDGLAGPLALLHDQVAPVGGPLQRELRAWIERRFAPGLGRLGWTPERAEPAARRLRRGALLRLVGGVAESAPIQAEAERRLAAYLRDRDSLDPNLADVVVGLAARGGDLALYRRYRRVVDQARTPQERRRFLLSLASFRDPAVVDRLLTETLTPGIPTQDVAFLYMRLFGNPAAGDKAWAFLTKRWTAIRKRIPPLMISRLVEATPALREPRHAKAVRAFFTAHPVAEATRALKQAQEVFRLNAELRRRVTPGLRRWLAARAG